MIDALRRGTDSGHLESLFDEAERHGLAGVLFDSLTERGASLPKDLERQIALREAARACDHHAHLEVLRELDAALKKAKLNAVVLKGALLGARLYPRPSARPTSDVDLLVREADLERAVAALTTTGYHASDAPSEARFRREGHHLHLHRARSPALELHFHAYRGFGGVLRSEPLLDRSTPSGHREPELQRLRVLAPEDELVYLAIHAAGHRFMRLGWLYDITLLLGRLTSQQLERASDRASEVRMSRPFALALAMTHDLFGVNVPDTHALRGRRHLLSVITEEPTSSALRAVTRFAYSIALCEDRAARADYARGAIVYKARALWAGDEG